jgi:GNAT superfamily N-acetyltransferase
MIKIRLYSQDDLVSLTELMADLGYPTSIDKMRRRMEFIEAVPLYHTFVAVINEQVVGMMGIRQVYYYEEDGLVTQISALVTKEGFQGQGIGSALVKHVEEWAIKQESNCLYLTSGIKPERVKAHEFYKALGFEVTGYRFVKKLDSRGHNHE